MEIGRTEQCLEGIILFGLAECAFDLFDQGNHECAHRMYDDYINYVRSNKARHVTHVIDVI